MTEPGASDVYEVAPPGGPLDAVARVPGSKSITNRALVAAALADGTSELAGALLADDTEAMLDCLTRLGVSTVVEPEAAGTGNVTVRVVGRGGVLAPSADLDARQSGTTSRFLLPVLATAHGRWRVDGDPQLRDRPMGPVIAAARRMGADVEELGEAGRLPVEVRADGSKGGTVTVAGDASSQFLSGLLLAGPATGGGLELAVQGHLVSRPYVDMTVSVMRVFGARVTVGAGGDRWRVEPGGYRPATLAVEPDASAASYFMAAAAIVGGSVRIPGLTRGSLQGDVAFADVLERMGVRVDWSDAGVTVTGTGVLRGIEVDLGDLTDTAQTLAAVAVFAEGPTRVTGIGFIRGKETDRVGHPVAELRRLGIEAEEEADGFVVRPGTPRPGLVETYGDHRMAMAFALLGLRVPGIRIADPACVGKTFPGYWRALEGLSR